MEKYTYKTRGVCSRQISFESDGKIVRNVIFGGGCSGNTQGVAKLVDGMEVYTAKEYWPFPTYGDLLFSIQE